MKLSLKGRIFFTLLWFFGFLFLMHQNRTLDVICWWAVSLNFMYVYEIFEASECQEIQPVVIK